MANKIIQLRDELGNNIYPITTIDALYGSGALANVFVDKKGDTMVGNLTAPKFIGPLQGNADSASKVNNSLSIQLNGGTATIFNGSAAKSINITPAAIGAAAASHGTHVTYSTTAPVMDGAASVGSAATVARSDHKHPTDTSRAAASDLTSHTGNTTIHITATERTNWNAAKTHADSAHAPTNAEKNQNAFSNIVVGSTTISADTVTDSLTLVGSNVTLTPDATNDKVTIGITKENVTTALGYTPPTQDTTYGSMSSSEGITGTATTNRVLTAANLKAIINGSAAAKLTTARTISLTGSVTGSGTFDGSGNLSIATSTNHNHDSTYVKVTGDTMTGALNFQNNILNKVGDDSAFGDQNLAGHFIIQGLNGTTALGFKEYGATNIASIYSNGTKIWTGANALLPCWSTLTGGNANVAGWRLIGSHALGTWHNNRANFIINSRHTGNGLLSIAYGCNAGEINQANVYCDVVISGNSSGAGSIWNNNAFKCYYNSTNNYLYFFWYYTDYNATDIISFGSPISDFYPEDGTWVETIDAATYGVEITTLRRSWNQGDAVTGAVWNDYAECRESDCEEFGYVLMEVGDDSLTKTTERLSHFAGVSSDTWGFSQGETDKAKTPIAVAGRVLVYPYQDRNNYKPGDCVCAAPGGTVDIMTREEVKEWPDRIVGTVSCVPDYEEWGGGQGADRDPVKINGRIWIKIK